MYLGMFLKDDIDIFMVFKTKIDDTVPKSEFCVEDYSTP